MVEWIINNEYLVIIQDKDHIAVMDIKEAKLMSKQVIAFGRKCTIPGCNKKHQGRGYCNTHYARWLHYGDPNYLWKKGMKKKKSRKYLTKEESLYPAKYKNKWR